MFQGYVKKIAFVAMGILVLGLLYPTPIKQASNTASDQGGETMFKQTYGKSSLSFEANKGQTDDQVKFLSRGNMYSLFLTSTEAVLTLRKPIESEVLPRVDLPKLDSPTASIPTFEQSVLRMQLVGANPDTQMIGLEELPGKVNYFIGNDPTKWQTNIQTYAKVHYQDLYPGIDLVYYGNQGKLEYDFVVSPSADPSAIRLAFEGIDKVEINAQGDLVLHVDGEQIRMDKPVVYQEVNGVRKEISAHYIQQDTNRISFRLGAYDVGSALTIDPVLVYSTYLGGGEADEGHDIAVSSTGYVYVAGVTRSVDFPTTSGAFQTVFGGNPPLPDVFVAKYSPTGSLVFSTFLGGNAGDEAYGIALDSSGNAFIAGFTSSDDFPTTIGAFRMNHDSTDQGDVFITKIDASGTALIYSTYLGGKDNDWAGFGGYGHPIAVNSSGNAYVTGRTKSADFPLQNPLDANFHGPEDSFVTKLNAEGSGLIYSTYIGGGPVGASYCAANAIVVDAYDNAYVTGGAIAGFPTTPSAFLTTNNTIYYGNPFVLKLNPSGSERVYSTFLSAYHPGDYGSHGTSITVDITGNAYVTGIQGPSLPTTPGAFQTTWQNAYDAFVVKLNATGSDLIYATYLGGSIHDQGEDIAVDSAGNAYIIGTTWSTDFPMANALQPSYGGGNCYDMPFPGFPPRPCYDAFLTKLDPTGSSLVFSTYLGGDQDEHGFGVDVDTNDNVYVTGWTSSLNFPIVNAVQPFLSGVGIWGIGDAFIAKIAGQGINQPSTGNLIFPNSGLNALQEYDPISKNIVQTIQLPTPYTYTDPPMLWTALIRTGDNTIFTNVRDPYNKPILLAISSNGQLLAAKGTSGGWFQQITFDPEDTAQNTIIGGVPMTFNIEAVNPFANTISTRIAHPNANFIGLVTDNQGKIYAGDHQAGEILLYDKLGAFLGIFADVGHTTGNNEINGMTLDENGNLYVTQNSYYRIAKYSSAGIFQGVITNPNFNRPISVFYNPNDGLIYVGNGNDGKLIILTPDGIQVGIVNMGGKSIGTPALVHKENTPPTADAGGSYIVNEGLSVTLTATGSDPEGQPLTYRWDLDNNDTFETPGQSVSFAGVDGPATLTVKVQVTDSGGLTAVASTTVTVNNIPPTITSIVAPVSPVQLGTTVNANATFTDPGVLDTHTTVWDWGDNTSSVGTVDETNGSGSATGNHIYTSSGVYSVKVTVTDKDGGIGIATYQYVVVYDPNGGFVTGGGWINSPLGAYTPDPTLTGKATFGFVSKYLKGANVPTGNTEFQFHVAGMNFKSTSYDWLVIAGNKAQYKGTGTINGAGEYKFMLTAIDGTPDKFRIKIWNETTGVVYDNQFGVSDAVDPTTAIQGGSIVIHKAN